MSPSTYFRASRHNQADVGGRPAGHVAANFNIGPGLRPVHYGQDMPAGYYPGVNMPNRKYVHPGSQVAGSPDAQYRKLALQFFDGKELYHGLGSRFIE